MRTHIVSFLASFILGSAASADPLEIFIDADYSVAFAAAEAIELGVQTALDEVDNQLGGMPVVLVRKDHRGNSKRSHQTMKQYLESDNALLMIGGLHSPPYITHGEFISENRVLTLLPWSAGAPITRVEAPENWLFRVSVDDSKSGEFFVRDTLENQGCSDVALVLLDSSWGRAGESAIATALAARNKRPLAVHYFPFSIGEAAAGTLAGQIASSGADCVIMMVNAGNGAILSRALHEKAKGLRVFSHWGIMGGTFAQDVPHAMRTAMNLRLLQTCALRVEASGSAVLTEALARARPGARSVAEVGAVTGFVHGYDLTRIAIAAAEQAADTTEWQSGSIKDRRMAMHAALENLQAPVEGILKTYNPPFRPWTGADEDAHEALGLEDLCMAQFQENGLLRDAD